MTTRDQQIAAAVIEAAAKECEHMARVLDVHGAHRCANAIRALDLDAILASVPKDSEPLANFCLLIDELLASWNVTRLRPEQPDTPEVRQRRIDARLALETAIDRLRKAEAASKSVTDDQVIDAVRAYVQAGKRGHDLLGAMRCALETGLLAAPDSADSATERKS